MEENAKLRAELDALLARKLIPNDVILLSYLLIGLIGNVFVIYVYSFKMKSDTDNRYFIPVLAIVDLFACTVGSTFALGLNLKPVQFYGDYLCKTLWFFSEASTICSSLLLLFIAVHRYMKVCTPFDHQMSLIWRRIAVAVCVVSSCLVSAPSWLYYGEVTVRNSKTNITGVRCSAFYHDKNMLLGLTVRNLILVTLLCAGVMGITVMYALIGRTIYQQYVRHRRPKDKKRVANNEKETRTNKAKKKSTDDVNKNDVQLRRKSSACSSTYPSSLTSESETNFNTKRNSLMPDIQESESSDLLQRVRRVKRSSFDALRASIPRIRPENVWNHFRVFKYSYMFMTITLVFIISYLPRVVLMVLESVRTDFWDTLGDWQIQLCLFLYRMYLINHVTNPFVYGFFDTRFRNETKKMLCPCVKK